MIQIEIEETGYVLQMSQKNRIRVTFQAADFADAGSTSGSFSTTASIPLTAEVSEALGFATVKNVISQTSPYRNIAARLLDNNNEIDRGFLRIDEDEEIEGNVKITFFGKNVDWFNSIGDKTLHDLDLSRFDHYNTVDKILEERTDGYIYLPVDYGSLAAKSSATITSSEIFPAVFAHTILRQIFQDLGYKVKGSLLKDPRLYRMLLPFCGITPYHSEQWKNDRVAIVSGTGVKQSNGTTTNVILQLDNVTGYAQNTDLRPSYVGNYDTSNYRYTADEPMIMQIEVHAFNGAGYLPDPTFDDYMYLDILKNGVLVHENFFGSLEYQVPSITLASGDYLEIYFRKKNTDVGTSILWHPTYMPVGKVKSFFAFYPTRDIVAGSQVQISNYVANIKQKEFIEYIFAVFGVIPSFEKYSNSVVLNSITDLTIDNAEDWSDKLDLSQSIETSYNDFVSNYAKKNTFKYTDLTDDTLLQAYKAAYSSEYGEGSIDINNDYLDGQQDYYEAPFGATKSRNVFTGVADLYLQLPYIKQDDSPTPRILYYAPNVSVEELTQGIISTISIAGQNVTHIPYAYFLNNLSNVQDPIINDNLGFGGSLENTVQSNTILQLTYSKLEKVLNNPNVVRASFNLNAFDISNVDYTKLKYIEYLGGYYYLNSIGQYDGSGESTECELIKWY
jgi:hypothetical protein